MATITDRGRPGSGLYAPLGARRGRALVYAPNLQQLHKFSKAMQKMFLGAADARVLVVGPSTAAGIKSSTDATVPVWRSWSQQMCSILNAGFAPCAPGLGIPKTNSSAQAADTRWTAGSGWTLNSGSSAYVGAGNKGAYYTGANVTSGSLVYADPTISADTFDVYYVNNNTGGSFTVQATGGSTTTVNVATPGTKTIGKVTVSAGSTATTNTVTMTGATASKSVTVIGVEPYLSTTRKIRVGNMAACGSSTADWVGENNLGVTFWGGTDFIKAYAPDLLIIDAALLINDIGNSIALTTGVANISTLAAAGQVSGDVLIKTPLPSTSAAVEGSVTSGIPALEAAMITPLIGLGLPLIDTFSAFGTLGGDYLSSVGDMAGDGLHGGDFAYGDEAQMMAGFFRSL